MNVDNKKQRSSLTDNYVEIIWKYPLHIRPPNTRSLLQQRDVISLITFARFSFKWT